VLGIICLHDQSSSTHTNHPLLATLINEKPLCVLFSHLYLFSTVFFPTFLCCLLLLVLSRIRTNNHFTFSRKFSRLGMNYYYMSRDLFNIYFIWSTSAQLPTNWMSHANATLHLPRANCIAARALKSMNDFGISPFYLATIAGTQMSKLFKIAIKCPERK